MLLCCVGAGVGDAVGWVRRVFVVECGWLLRIGAEGCDYEEVVTISAAASAPDQSCGDAGMRMVHVHRRRRIHHPPHAQPPRRAGRDRRRPHASTRAASTSPAAPMGV